MLNFLKPSLPPCGYHLKYLFIAELYNGSIIAQTPDDKPKFAKSGSSFTDVVPVLHQVKRFTLQSTKIIDSVKTYEGLAPYLKLGERAVVTLDLVDGHCEINGHRIYAPAEVPPGVKFKLIYYRTVGRSMNVQAEVQHKSIFSISKPAIEPRVAYTMGWEYLGPNGKTRKWEMKLS